MGRRIFCPFSGVCMYYNNKPLSTKRHWIAATILSLMMVGTIGFIAEVAVAGMSTNSASAASKQR